MTKKFVQGSLIVLFLFSCQYAHSQVLNFDHGEVEFYTSSILSDIEASSEEIQATIDLQTKQVDITIPIESFEFEYEMMQDHFNEEYMESDKYPNATFQGTISEDISNLSAVKEVSVAGQLTIHGVTKESSFKAQLSKKDEFTMVKCKFTIVFSDYDVDEPSILTKSVAKDVEMKSTLYLK